MAQNTRLQILQDLIKEDLGKIDKRARGSFSNEDGNMSKLSNTNLLSVKSELRPVVEDMKIGQLGPNIQSFCPMKLLSRLPSLFLTRKLGEDVAELFFTKDRFWGHQWVLYYVWPVESDLEPLILIPDVQFKDFLALIQEQLPSASRLNEKSDLYWREENLLLDFPEHPRFTPRFLGISDSRRSYDRLLGRVPGPSSRGADNVVSPPPDEHQEAAFSHIMTDVENSLNKENRRARRLRKMERLKLCNRQLKDAQRYLGLRPDAPSMEDGSLNPIESEIFPIKLDAVVPFPFHWEPVIISIDFEAWERDHSYVTEVGVAVLDTRKIASIPPGRDGKNWVDKIRARHFRIDENVKLVNSAFVQGNPDMFNFGESEFVSKLDAREALCGILMTPDDEPDPDCNDDDNNVMMRNFIIIGHNVEADMSILRSSLNIQVWATRWCLGVLDTQKMWHSVQNGSGGNQSLGSILTWLKIDHQFLHNAGNDAMYTLQAFTAMALREGVLAGESLELVSDGVGA